MAVLPTIPASYTTLTKTNYRRGVAILEAQLQSLQEGVNFTASQRTKVALRKSWMQLDGDAAPDPVILGTDYDASVAGYVTSIAKFTPSERVTRLIWSTRAEDGTLTLEIATDYAFSDTRYYDNTHPAGSDTLRTRTIAVEPGTDYYMRIEADNGVGNITLWSASVIEDELNGSDLAMHVPEYATVTAANTALSPTGGEVCTINGHLMYFRAGADLEYPGRSDGAAGIWVPYQFRDAIARAVIDGSAAVGTSPNSDWGWAETTNGTGTVTPAQGAGDRLDFTGDGTNDAYWELTAYPTTSRGWVVYAEVYIISQAGSSSWAIDIDDDGVSRQRFGASGSTDGTATVNNEASFVWAMGDETATKILLTSDDGTTAGTVVYDYETMDVKSAELRTAIGGGGTEHIIIGCTIVAAAADWGIIGFPAFAYLELPA